MKLSASRGVIHVRAFGFPGHTCYHGETNTLLLDSHIWDAIRLVWPDSHWATDDSSNYSGIDSRL